MLWPQLNEMAPTGRILIDNEIVPATELIRQGYSSVTTKVTNMARNMVTEEIEYINDAKGNFIKNELYDVYLNKGEHCLSVYGARMLQDCLIEEQNNEVRFDYTGLQ